MDIRLECHIMAWHVMIPLHAMAFESNRMAMASWHHMAMAGIRIEWPWHGITSHAGHWIQMAMAWHGITCHGHLMDVSDVLN